MSLSYKICLIVEDDPDDQEIFQLAVAQVSDFYNCIFTNNAIDALKKLQENYCHPDFIFIDLNMPMLDGLQCLVEIKKQPNHVNTPVVIYSTSSEESHINQAIGLGASAFITKPSSVPLLADALHHFFNSHK